MLNASCERFREQFETAGPQGHAEACASCRAWASEVASLQTFGADLPLPPALRRRLGAVPARDAADEGVLLPGALPQVPLPSDLLAKLYRIPLESRPAAAGKPAAARSGELIAASVLFAALLTFGVGDALSPADHPGLAAASRMTGVVFREAGNRGTKTLLGVGESILDGCLEANRSLEKIVGRIGEPRRVPSPSTPGPTPEAGAPSRPPSTQGKENPHGSRPTH